MNYQLASSGKPIATVCEMDADDLMVVSLMEEVVRVEDVVQMHGNGMRTLIGVSFSSYQARDFNTSVNHM